MLGRTAKHSAAPVQIAKRTEGFVRQHVDNMWMRILPDRSTPAAPLGSQACGKHWQEALDGVQGLGLDVRMLTYVAGLDSVCNTEH
jgi:hypothetical protein